MLFSRSGESSSKYFAWMESDAWRSAITPIGESRWDKANVVRKLSRALLFLSRLYDGWLFLAKNSYYCRENESRLSTNWVPLYLPYSNIESTVRVISSSIPSVTGSEPVRNEAGFLTEMIYGWLMLRRSFTIESVTLTVSRKKWLDCGLSRSVSLRSTMILSGHSCLNTTRSTAATETDVPVTVATVKAINNRRLRGRFMV